MMLESTSEITCVSFLKFFCQSVRNWIMLEVGNLFVSETLFPRPLECDANLCSIIEGNVSSKQHSEVAIPYRGVITRCLNSKSKFVGSTELYKFDIVHKFRRYLMRMLCCFALQVLVEVALSLVLCLWAALKVPGPFLPILPDAKENR